MKTKTKKPKKMTRGQKARRGLKNMAVAGLTGLVWGFARSEATAMASAALKHRGEKLLSAKKKPMRKAA